MDVVRESKSQKMEHITDTMYNLVCELTAVAAALSTEMQQSPWRISISVDLVNEQCD